MAGGNSATCDVDNAELAVGRDGREVRECHASRPHSRPLVSEKRRDIRPWTRGDLHASVLGKVSCDVETLRELVRLALVCVVKCFVAAELVVVQTVEIDRCRGVIAAGGVAVQVLCEVVDPSVAVDSGVRNQSARLDRVAFEMRLV